jgi:hypothetical protein
MQIEQTRSYYFGLGNPMAPSFGDVEMRYTSILTRGFSEKLGSGNRQNPLNSSPVCVQFSDERFVLGGIVIAVFLDRLIAL